MKTEDNLIRIDEPVVIVGDVHGQYYDICNMLNKVSSMGSNNFLFLGDYVDRGIYGI